MTPADLRAARLRLGLTQAQLAARLRMKSGDRTIRRMERGEVAVSGPVQVAVEMMLERLVSGEGEG
jgi:transcriptional regulator with XRE-family HTH domain